jgi:hypothetical protein
VTVAVLRQITIQVAAFRFQAMDRNGNRVIERDEWNGSRGSFERSRLEP